ncbi:alpha/beta hydrolase [Maritimibacter sp. UBA3975]|uniref:alpha/beta hydrolase n=1 Tax=Maritimibacter sp. UBA3975 TaxID=1946833 RepID=UPI000C0A0F9D|nr:alpha/beta hydrolase [Maritimibacter sp. UBA3975]MAM61408.1 lipase [Maritimibacter sp.]|tara:strand:- start:54756 stop:55595 length:840 start_codon:yes stop_codon:yes gene_type:complete
MAARDLYRNRDFIPDFDAIMAETEARSRAFADTVRVERNLSYGATPRQSFDLVFPPDPAPGAPLHMFIHGGYWRAGEKEAHTLVAAPVVAAGGITALIGYDLMPGTRLAEIVAQVRRAARHIVDLAPEIDADAARFTVSGHSAGAHLASLLAAEAPGDKGALDVPDLRAMLLVSGVYDLSGIPGSFLRDEAGMRDDEAEAWSPLRARHMPGPRRIITRGETETAPFQEQAVALGALLDREAPDVEVQTVPSANHLTVVFELGNPTAPLGRTLSGLVRSS